MLDFLCVFDILISVMRNLDELKEQLQEDASTWYEGLESLDDEIYGCAKMVTNSGPVYNETDNDIARLCDIIINRINEYKMFDSAQLVVNDEIHDFGPEC